MAATTILAAIFICSTILVFLIIVYWLYQIKKFKKELPFKFRKEVNKNARGKNTTREEVRELFEEQGIKSFDAGEPDVERGEPEEPDESHKRVQVLPDGQLGKSKRNSKEDWPSFK